MKLSWIWTAAVLSACSAGQEPLSSSVQRADIIPGAYARLAGCVYQRLDARFGTAIRKTDLPSESRIAFAPDSVRRWEIVLAAEGQNRTRATVSTLNTLVGPVSPEAGWQEVAACAA